MVEVAGENYGQAIPDQLERIATLFDVHLEMISDVRDLYQNRVALEREYATKLQLLVRKTVEKKAKMESSFVLGDDPTKQWDVNNLKQNSLNSAYEEMLNSMLNSAQDHVDLADSLTSQVIEVLKIVGRRSEESKKKEMQFFQKLLADRDRVYADRIKSKQKYDEDCTEVESFRQKQGRAQDDKHAQRAAKQAEQQRNDMLNSKNIYLISTAIANQAKAKFYNEDMPNLENQFQILQGRLVERFVKIMLHSQNLQLGHLDTLKNRLNGVALKLNGVNCTADQNLFIQYNIRPFTAPANWIFEPCGVHYDTEEMSVDDAPKTFLQNKLIHGRSKLSELAPLINSKRQELNQLSSQVMAYTADHSVGNIDELSDMCLDAQHQMAFYTVSECNLKAEIDCIIAAIGDDLGVRKPHSFKSSSFSIPTQCGYCKSSIWGLSKQGKTCKLCGLSVHNKCELKVPASCGQSEGGQSVPLTRSSTTSSYRSVRESTSASTRSDSSILRSTTTEVESYPAARVLYDFTPTSEFELEVTDGAIVHVLEPDDGSGWVKVADANGHTGLVPASYLESDAGGESTKKVVQRGSGERVRALYPYKAQGGDELGLQEGDILELSNGPAGGKNYGDGWWEGYNSRGDKGIFPSNYVESI